MWRNKMKILILLVGICVCSGDQTEPRRESTNYREDSVLENEEINNLDGVLPSEKEKSFTYSEPKTRGTEQPSTVTFVPADQPQKQNPYKTTTPSTGSYDKTVTETIGKNRENEQETVASATGNVARKQNVHKDSQISDIPADELIPLSTGDYSLNSESSTAASTKDITVTVDNEAPTVSGISSQSDDTRPTSVSPIVSSDDTIVPSESTVLSEETSEQPTKTSQVTITTPDVDRRKTPGVSYVTEKVPQKDTPVYPIFPTFTTRPPFTKGQLDIKISIPNIFHLSLGDTPDGRRRLGIQAPFFKFDLTKPRFFKVFHK